MDELKHDHVRRRELSGGQRMRYPAGVLPTQGWRTAERPVLEVLDRERNEVAAIRKDAVSIVHGRRAGRPRDSGRLGLVVDGGLVSCAHAPLSPSTQLR